MNDQIKKQFLLYLESKHRSADYLTRTQVVFHEVAPMEEKLQKDASQFDLLEVQNLYIECKWSTFVTLYKKTTILNNYTQWVLDHELLDIPQRISKFSFFDKPTIQRWLDIIYADIHKYTTYKSITDVIATMEPREAFIVQGLLEGISPARGYEEFALAEIQHIKGNTMTLYKYQEDGKTVPSRSMHISDKLKKYAVAACDGSELIIHTIDDKNQSISPYQRQRQISRLTVIITQMYSGELSATDIYKYGIYFYIQKTAEQNGISLQDVIARADLADEICRQYGIKVKRKYQYLENIIKERQ